jgi:xanthine dehydrogenase YagS FAD-binding subunit
MLPSFAYVQPRTLDEAIDHLAHGDARLLAGGSDLLGCLRDGVFVADRLVSLSALAELRGIRIASDGLHIGALTPLSEVAASESIREGWPGLAAAAGEVASPQLRNQGTVGGNLCQKPRCWYYRGDLHCLRKGGDDCFALDGENAYHCILGESGCCIVHPSDTAPALIALAASAQIAGPAGERSVDLGSFFVSPADDVTRETVLEPGEILTEVFLPNAATGTVSNYRKVRARRSWDFALAGLAHALQMEGSKVLSGRVVLAGVAPIPWRSTAVEEVIVGAELTPKTIARAAAASVEGAASLGQNTYKIQLVRGMVEEELSRVAGR